MAQGMAPAVRSEQDLSQVTAWAAVLRTAEMKPMTTIVKEKEVCSVRLGNGAQCWLKADGRCVTDVMLDEMRVFFNSKVSCYLYTTLINTFTRQYHHELVDSRSPAVATLLPR